MIRERRRSRVFRAKSRAPLPAYNNNWNKNWNKRAHVRNWNRKPYYGEFIGGIVLGSILAANGIGVVPYAPDPNLCWYWADPYMERGYWDYCY